MLVPKVVPEYLEQRRRQILDASAACFARRGFHQATMQDICEEAQLSPGAVYRYFRSKDDIIVAMCERAYVEDADAVRTATEGHSTPEVFGDLIRIFFLDFEASHTAEMCALVTQLASEAPRNETIRASLVNTGRERRTQFADLIRAGQARGEIESSLDAENVARVMIAVYQGLIVQKLVEPDIDVRAYADVLLSLFGGTFWRGEAAADRPTFSSALSH
jgi:AcrR family transcriptional regulator